MNITFQPKQQKDIKNLNTIHQKNSNCSLTVSRPE